MGRSQAQKHTESSAAVTDPNCRTSDGHGIKCHLLREEYRDRVDFEEI